MAAVSDVLPWSTWPMVPMFTWGLDLSNFSLAMTSPGGAGPQWPAIQIGGLKGVRRASKRLKDQQKSAGRVPNEGPLTVQSPLLSGRIVAELHGVGGSSLALAAQVR